MPGIAAAGLHLELARRQVELIVEDVDVALRDLQVALRFADGTTALVHVGLRLQQDDAAAADRPIAGEPLKALFQGPSP